MRKLGFEENSKYLSFYEASILVEIQYKYVELIQIKFQKQFYVTDS